MTGLSTLTPRVLKLSFPLLAVLLGAFVSLFLVSCAADIQRDRMTNALNAWMGRSVAEFALERGNPTEIIDLGPNRRGFRWVLTEATPSVAAMLPGTNMLVSRAPGTRSCTISLDASSQNPSVSLADWRIEHWGWNGAC